MAENKSIRLGRGYDALVSGISQILKAGRSQATWTLNSVMSAVYWEIGRRIVEFEQKGNSGRITAKRLLNNSQ